MRKKIFLILMISTIVFIAVENSSNSEAAEVGYIGKVCMSIGRIQLSTVKSMQIVVGVTSFGTDFYALNGYIKKAETWPIKSQNANDDNASPFKETIHLEGTPLIGTAIVIDNNIKISLQGGSKNCGDNEGYCEPYIGYNILNINLTRKEGLNRVRYEGEGEYVYWYDFEPPSINTAVADYPHWQISSDASPMDLIEIVPCSSFQ